MSHTIRRTASMAVGALLTGALALGATALAATPKKGARFSGHLSTPPVEGFKAPVKFRVDPSGKLLDNFTFGTFGCFGAGGFRPGVNPYTGDSLINAGAIKLAHNGSFSQTKLAGYSVRGQQTTFNVKVSGRFSSRSRASGTIVFTESGGGGSGKCTSSTLSFTASS